MIALCQEKTEKSLRAQNIDRTVSASPLKRFNGCLCTQRGKLKQHGGLYDFCDAENADGIQS